MAASLDATSSTRSTNVVQRCEDHFKWLYPSYDKRTTVMCPPFFEFGYKAPTEESASGYSESVKKIEHTIRGDKAEKLVFRALEDSGEPMFVISSLKYTSFLQSILERDIEMDENRELDFVIVHWEIGVLLVEVKNKDSDTNYRKAVKQLKNYEQIIRDLLNIVSDALQHSGEDLETDMQIEIPVYKIYAIPNDEVKKQSKTCTQMDRNALQNIPNWLKSNFQNRTFSEDQQEVLHKLCSVLVGQKTEITTCGEQTFSDRVLPHRLLGHIHGIIDRQRFLKQSHKQEVSKKNRKEKQERKVVSTKDKPHLSILNEKFLFLNSEQLAVWEGPLHQVIDGATGSGKTILLLYKALECARKGEQVRVFVHEELLGLYNTFFKEHDIDKPTVTVQPFCLYNYVSDLLEPKCHVFIDEFQLGPCRNPVKTKAFSLVKVEDFKFQEDAKKYYWIACNKMQIMPMRGRARKAIASGQYQNSKEMNNLQTWLSNLEKIGFHRTVMHTCVRFSLNIYDFVQDFVERSSAATLSDGIPSMIPGHNVLGPEVGYNVVDNEDEPLSHEISGETHSNAKHESTSETEIPSMIPGHNVLAPEVASCVVGNEDHLYPPHEISIEKHSNVEHDFKSTFKSKLEHLSNTFKLTLDRMSQLPVMLEKLQSFLHLNCSRIAEIVEEEIETSSAPQTYNDIAVLTLNDTYLQEISEAITNKGIPVSNIPYTDSNAVYIGIGTRMHSYQWNTVFVVTDPAEFLHNYTMFTRAISKLVVIFY